MHISSKVPCPVKAEYGFYPRAKQCSPQFLGARPHYQLSVAFVLHL